MTHLQEIRAEAKKHNLKFVATKSTINGARLYNFVNEFGNAVARNWTITSAYEELLMGNLENKIT